VLGAAVLALAIRFGIAAGAGPPPPPAHPPAVPPTTPTIVTSQLRYEARPAPGVWAELMLILDNPLPDSPGGATRAVLLVPGSLLEDFRLRETEPRLVAQPERRSDGRDALTFPPPLAQTLNWYRLELEVLRPRPRPVQVSLLLDRPPFQTRLNGVRVIYADREADPFGSVPEALLAWLPGNAAGALPLLVAYTTALALLILGGCAAAFRAVRHAT
jgi:hypothetical protein